MLRLLPRLIAALLALLVLLIGLLAVLLPRIVERPEFRAALREQVGAAIGTPVDWRDVDAGLFPPRLVIDAPELRAAQADPEVAALTAGSLDLRLSAGALLRRRVEVDSLVVRGLELVVTRTPEGLVLPLDPADEGDPGDEAEPPEEPGADEGFELALRRFVLRDARIVLHDRALPEPVAWRLEALDLEARGDALDQPLDLELSARLAAGDRPIGGLSVSGRASLGGLYDLALELDALRLDAFQPYVDDVALAGALSGRIDVEGASDVVSAWQADVAIAELRAATGGLALTGDMKLDAKQALDEPVAFVADLDLGEAGRAKLDGTLTLEGEIETEAELTNLDLAPFARFANETLEVAGRATGRVDLAANGTDGLRRLETDLRIADARVADGEARVAGDLDLKLGLEGLGEADPIRFDAGLDLATGGRLDAEGTATSAGAVDGQLVLAGVDLAVIGPWVRSGTRIEGTISGDVDARVTPERRVERLRTKLSVSGARLADEAIDVSGRLALEATLEDAAGPIRLALDVTLDDESRLGLQGTSTVDGVVDLEAQLDRFDLAIARPFLPEPEMQLAGRASGTGKLVGAPASPEFLGLDVGVEEGLFRTEEYAVEGPFLAMVKVKEPFSRPRGRVELDLTAARLVYRDQFDKAAGTRAELVTRFVPEESGEIVFESRLKLRDVDEILMQGAITDEKVSIALTTTDVELAGWGEVFPVLAPYEVDGRIAVEGLGTELVEGEPRSFYGRVAIRGIGVTVPGTGRVRLRGSILGEGARIRTQGLKALVGGATLGLKGSLEDPLGEARFELEVQSIGETDVNEVLTALTSVRDTVFGPLALEGRVTGRAGGEGELTDTLDGRLGFSIGQREGGRLRGVSLLRTVLDQLPLLGGAARLSRPFRGGRSVDDYFSERFDVIEGDFVVGDGRIEAKLLRLAYPGYEARLKGPVRLRDLSIDMTGELLLKSDLVSTLGGLAGGTVAEREPIRIPLARVTNTLDDPKVRMTPETLAAVPKLLFQATGLDTLTLGVGKALGRALGGGDRREDSTSDR